MPLFKEKVFAIVDVETTGASPIHDRVIEIGILRIEGGKVVKTFSSLINPEKHLSPFITSMTGIDPEELLTAPTFEDVRSEIEGMLEGAIFVAHNARFDYGFVKNELKRSGIAFNAKCLCTVRLSRKLFPEEKRHDLSSLIERHGLLCTDRHRAFADAEVLWNFIEKVRNDGREEELELHVRELLKESTLPQFLNEKSVRALSEGPGVYIFYGPENEVLYVGKSKNIRYRVLSHFSNDHASQKEMNLCQQTVRVEARETAGELGALLLESELVKDWMPLYNRQLRKRTDLVVAKLKSGGLYPEVELGRAKTVSEKDQKSILGIFRSESQAKAFLRDATHERGLCPRLLGAEKGKGACFSHQLGVCSGACVNKAEKDAYAKAFNAVFKARRIRSWPFGGPILIEEKVDEETKHSFVLDNWCLIADVRTEPDNTVVIEHYPRFDYDAYKIFLRYVRDPLTKKRIKRITKKELDQALVSTYAGEVY
ncbi:MAG: polC [Parcubacteria group bacterium]|nr:polC [Parcubacteria group bacterium]